MASDIQDLPSSSADCADSSRMEHTSTEIEHDSLEHETENSGIIVRIELFNFMTYRHVELLPGPHMNLIAGPKHPGKSALICAICLGLGVKPALFSQNATASSFVKAGKKRAQIIIELHDPLKNINTVIRRMLTKEGRSTFHVNNRIVDEDDVVKEITRLNIHMNTLVQFLPLDRVVHFAKMNSVELLESMELAMVNRDLFIYHNELKNLGAENRRLQEEITTKVQQLTAKTKESGKDRRNNEILEHKEELRNTISKFQSLQDEIEKKKAFWLSPLEAVIHEINNLFSKYLKYLGCAGEVILKANGSPEDFDMYGLSISVKFRNDIPHLEHSDAQLSISEQAVSSIIFYLALQNVTQAPFKCVEIDECVDPVFEKKIFKLMAWNFSSSETAQSFLVTRRVLTGIDFPENIKIHVVTNAPGAGPNVDFKLPKIVDNLRNEKETIHTAG